MSERLFTLRPLAGPFGDETSQYQIQFTKSCTVRQFIQYILTLHEWGAIQLTNKSHHYTVEYNDMVLCESIPNEWLDSIVIYGQGWGGWSRMDYNIIVTGICFPDPMYPKSPESFIEF